MQVDTAFQYPVFFLVNYPLFVLIHLPSINIKVPNLTLQTASAGLTCLSTQCRKLEYFMSVTIKKHGSC